LFRELVARQLAAPAEALMQFEQLRLTAATEAVRDRSEGSAGARLPFLSE
jgi:hypothetical protein